MRGHDIVVLGASAGGVAALKEILRRLPHDLPASLFIVVHLTPHVPSYLPQVLLRSGRLPAIAVTRPMRFRAGHVYVAPPDRHLILTPTEVRPSRGPRENRHRPSIDVLFRSAANALGPRVVGVVLTGFLDDGTVGLAAIKRKGGLAIVQDPEDALFPDMPINAIRSGEVDACVPLAEMTSAIVKAVKDFRSRLSGSPRRASAASGASAARTRRARRMRTPGTSRRT